uniref:hypothetical protein n=1 Tax=Thalassolituus sp. UBA1505 TaxID=1947653 RepID=UPI0025E25709
FKSSHPDQFLFYYRLSLQVAENWPSAIQSSHPDQLNFPIWPVLFGVEDQPAVIKPFPTNLFLLIFPFCSDLCCLVLKASRTQLIDSLVNVIQYISHVQENRARFAFCIARFVIAAPCNPMILKRLFFVRRS